MKDLNFEKKLLYGAEILVSSCAQLNPLEKALIIVDETTEEVGEYLYHAAIKHSADVKIMKTKITKNHGEEPNAEVAAYMALCDVVFGATKYSLAHTQARRNVCQKGGRYLSLADYDLNQLASSALTVDFLKLASIAEKLKEILDKGEMARITTPKGTDIKIFFAGRSANCCPGICHKPGTLGSPPDIETNISPLETKSEGIVIVDGSIPCEELGVLKNDIKIWVKNGSIKEFDTQIDEGRILKNIFARQKNAKAYVLAEFGIGLNPLATLCGRMLEDEGCLGTIHFGFGSNSTVGGTNAINFHLDCVIKNPTVYIDGIIVIKDGNLIIE